MRQLSRWGLLVVGLLALGSQFSHAQYARTAGAPGSAPAGAGRAIVYAVDGVTQLLNLSDCLSMTVEEAGAPITVRPVIWAKSGNVSTDFQDVQAQMMAAARLAADVRRARAASGGTPITIMGYCAGGRVALMAAEQLPPGIVDKIILIGPAVATNYDIRPALRTSRQGMDVFYVAGDSFLTKMETETGINYAGRRGFALGRNFPGLRQISVEGGHFTPILMKYLAENVMPLIPVGVTTVVSPPVPAPPPFPPGAFSSPKAPIIPPAKTPATLPPPGHGASPGVSVPPGARAPILPPAKAPSSVPPPGPYPPPPGAVPSGAIPPVATPPNAAPFALPPAATPPALPPAGTTGAPPAGAPPAAIPPGAPPTGTPSPGASGTPSVGEQPAPPTTRRRLFPNLFAPPPPPPAGNPPGNR